MTVTVTKNQKDTSERQTMTMTSEMIKNRTYLEQKDKKIYNRDKNSPYSPTVNETFLKATQNKETNKEDKDETMYTRYNKEED